MNINKLYDKLYELALDRNKIKTDLNNQMKPLFQHIVKLQLYGYNSDIVTTIYDIYSNLSDFNDTKVGRKYLNDKNVTDWLLNFVADEEEYLRAVKRLDNKLKQNYTIKQRIINYTTFLAVQDYIKHLLVEDIIEEKEQFSDRISILLGLNKS